MSKTSLFEFHGKITPVNEIPRINANYSCNRKDRSVSIDIEGSRVTIRFVAAYDSFEDIFEDTVEFVQSFLSVQSLTTHYPLRFYVEDWIETPLHPLGSDGLSHPARGRVYREDRNTPVLPAEKFVFALAEGIRWSEDIDNNMFLRRAIIDFNYALQHPISDVPIYLYRAIESAQFFFGGETQLIKSLDVGKQVKFVKKLANDSESGYHTRHAAKIPMAKTISEEEVTAAVEATSEILKRFQLGSWSNRIREENRK